MVSPVWERKGVKRVLVAAAPAAGLAAPWLGGRASLTSAARLPARQSGQADMRVRTTAWTYRRETADELNFTAINAYDSRGFTLCKSLRVEWAAGVQGASICVAAGSTNGQKLSDWARVNNIRNLPFVFEQKGEIRNACKAGYRDACCTDASQPAGPRASFPMWRSK